MEFKLRPEFYSKNSEFFLNPNKRPSFLKLFESYSHGGYMPLLTNGLPDLDEKDLAIIEVLRRNSKLRTVELAKETGIAPTTVHNRIKKMEKEGVIRKYVAIPDYKKLGRGITAFVTIKFSDSCTNEFEEKFVRWLKTQSSVIEAYTLTGRADALVKVVVNSVDDLDSFLKHLKESLKAAGQNVFVGTETHIALNEMKML